MNTQDWDRAATGIEFWSNGQIARVQYRQHLGTWLVELGADVTVIRSEAELAAYVVEAAERDVAAAAFTAERWNSFHTWLLYGDLDPTTGERQYTYEYGDYDVHLPPAHPFTQWHASSYGFGSTNLRGVDECSAARFVAQLAQHGIETHVERAVSLHNLRVIEWAAITTQPVPRSVHNLVPLHTPAAVLDLLPPDERAAASDILHRAYRRGATHILMGTAE